jgi:hypothetical protein
MLKTVGLFEESADRATVAGISAEIPNLFASKFDRLNRMAQIAVADASGLFNSSYYLNQKPDFVAATTGSSIDLFDRLTNCGMMARLATRCH